MRTRPAPEFAPLLRKILEERIGYGYSLPETHKLDLHMVTLQRGELLVGAGEENPYLYAVVDGLVKIGVVTADGLERVTHIAEVGQTLAMPMLTESTWFGPSGTHSSYVENSLRELRNGDTSYSVSALTDCSLLRMSYHQFEELAGKSMAWAAVCTHFLTVYSAINESRVIQFLTQTPTQRYQELVDTRGYLLELLPHRDIALLLGITPETLSRIRSRLAREAVGA